MDRARCISEFMRGFAGKGNGNSIQEYIESFRKANKLYSE
jgi:hypothetical protein